MLRKIIISFFYLGLGLFLISAAPAASQQKQAQAPGGEEPVKLSFEDMVGSLRQGLKIGGMLDDIWAYLAVAQNNSSICYNTDDPEDCRLSMNYILVLKHIAEGEPESIESPGLKKLSLALKNESSEGLPPHLLKLYQGLKDCDPSMVDEALSSPDIESEYGEWEPLDSIIFINLYYGFLTRSPDPKIAYDIKNMDMNDILGYKILFSPEGPGAAFDSILRDLAIFICVKEVGYPKEKINLIEDPDIRQLALDPDKRRLKDIFSP